jgi:hypothetical protein
MFGPAVDLFLPKTSRAPDVSLFASYSPKSVGLEAGTYMSLFHSGLRRTGNMMQPFQLLVGQPNPSNAAIKAPFAIRRQ